MSWTQPVMTSDSTPTPYATSASSVANGTVIAWKAMNGVADASNRWVSAVGNTAGAWWKLDIGVTNIIISQISIDNQVDYGLNSFKFQGSSNNSDWIDLLSDSCANNGDVQSFNISNSLPYRYYRILAVTTYSGSQLSIYEITMSGYFAAEPVDFGLWQLRDRCLGAKGSDAISFVSVRKRERLSKFGVSYGPKAVAYEYADGVNKLGGTVVSVDNVWNAYRLINSQRISPAFWYSADFAYKDAGSGLVSIWYDISDNENHAVQATGSSQPTWTSNQYNGLPTIRFDVDFLSFTAVTAKTIIFVGIKTAVTNSNVFIGRTGDAYMYIASGTAASGSSADYGNYTAAFTAPAGVPQTLRCISVNYSGGQSFLGRNKTLGAGVNDTLKNIDSLGKYGGTTGYDLKGDICEICAFTDELTATQRQAIEDYMIAKWGIT